MYVQKANSNDFSMSAVLKKIYRCKSKLFFGNGPWAMMAHEIVHSEIVNLSKPKPCSGPFLYFNHLHQYSLMPKPLAPGRKPQEMKTFNSNFFFNQNTIFVCNKVLLYIMQLLYNCFVHLFSTKPLIIILDFCFCKQHQMIALLFQKSCMQCLKRIYIHTHPLMGLYICLKIHVNY